MRPYLLILALASWITALPQGNTPDYFADGKKAADARNFTLAVENYKKAIAQKPDHGEAWYEMGWCYNELNNFTEAGKALDNAKLYLKDQPKVYFESGYTNQSLGKIEEAISDFRKCVEVNASYASAYRYLAAIYQDSKKDYKTAADYYNQYINYSRESEISVKTWYKKGLCENEAGQYEDAVESLKRALLIDNRYTDAYNELGYAYYQLARPDEAIEAYSNSRKYGPQTCTPCAGLGDVFRSLRKDVDMALKNYQDGLTIDPASLACNYGAGWCFNEKKNYAGALPFLQKATRVNSLYAPAYTELGYAYYALQRYDEAIIELSKSVQLANSSVPNYYMGLCYIAKKQKAKAQEIYQKLQSLNAKDASNLLEKINSMTIGN
jgi:tetratricopeptide (TPR) repeat protein